MIDASYYVRPPDVPLRVSSGGVAGRLDGEDVVVALSREHSTGYVLPKGGVEDGETLEQAARREILEEVGLRQLDLVSKLGTLERLAFSRQCWVLTHVFLFATTQVEAIPTDAKNHPGMGWFRLDDLPAMLWPEQRQLLIDQRDVIISGISA